MPSCSLHHWVLFFITLTFTTAPVSAAVCSTTAKLHQPVILPCEHRCSGLAKWTLFKNRDVIFAQCDQTSCRSLKEGYEMSRDQYLKGDLSLTIRNLNYSMRNTYACECGVSDISTVHLIIDTEFSALQLKSGEDLTLDVSVPESVEVIYQSSDSADGEQICNVTQHTLRCNAEYTPRTSLRHPELTLRGVQRSDSGSYTIRDTENDEDIQIYAVSVTDEQRGIPVWAIVMIVLALLAALTGLIMYLKIAPHQEFMKLSKRLQSVDKLVKQARPREGESNQSFIMTGASLKKAEKEMEKLERQYSQNRKYSQQVSMFCGAKRAELDKYRLQYSNQEQTPIRSEREGIVRNMEEVMKSLQQLRGGAGREQVDQVEQVEQHLEEIEEWCGEKRAELKDLVQQQRGGAV